MCFNRTRNRDNNTNNNRQGGGACLLCIQCVKWLPVLFIVCIVIWSYYAYVVQLAIFTVQGVFERTIYLVIYHICFIMFMWSYWQTIFTDIGKVPDKFKIPKSELQKLENETEEGQILILENFAKDLPVYNRNLRGLVRYCEKCVQIQPDRTHHCSVCGTCVLKMDHHCPWVNTCVSFYNYKYFILFVGYALLYCLYVAATSLQYFITFWKGEIEGVGKFHILFLFFVALMFAVSLVSFFGYHCYLVLHNRSTLEAFRHPIFRSGSDKNGFSLGRYNNFQEVFGDNPRTWLLPIFTSLGDGCEFPVSGIHQQPTMQQYLDSGGGANLSIPRTYNYMGNTRSSLGDGINYPQRHFEEDSELLLGENQWDDVGFASTSISLLEDA